MTRMTPLEWKEIVGKLESQARAVGAGEGASLLKKKVEEAISAGEDASAPHDVMDRLDLLLMMLTEMSRENVCANTKCPHYNKKCRMR
jgi:hypothetical protein